MIIKLEWTQSNTYLNKDEHRIPHKQWEVHTRSTTTEPSPKNGQQPKLLGGGFNAFYWRQIFALDTVDVKHKIV